MDSFVVFRVRGAMDRVSCLLALYVAAAGLSAGPAAGDDRVRVEGDTELLRLVMAAHQDNRERVSTWRGQARVDHKGYNVFDPDPQRPADEVEIAAVSFIRDAARQRADWMDEQILSPVRERQGTAATQMGFYRSIRGPDAVYRFEGRQNQEGGRRQLVIFPPDEKPFYKDLDPLAYLNRNGSNQDVEGVLSRVYERLTRAGAEVPAGLVRSVARVWREGDVVGLETDLEREGQKPIVDRYRFDLSQGGGLILHEHEDVMGRTRLEMAYEQQGDIWVPREYQRSRSILGRPEVPVRTLSERVTFTGNVINGPVGDEEFAMDVLGLTDRDLIVDRRNRAVPIVYQYVPGAGPATGLGEVLAVLGDASEADQTADVGYSQEAAREADGVSDVPATVTETAAGVREEAGTDRGWSSVLVAFGLLVAVAGGMAMGMRRRWATITR